MSDSIRVGRVARCAVFAILGVAASAPAQPQAAQALPTMPLSEVTRGMTGTGYTVVSGTVPEPFNAEVLGILHDTFPKHDLIVARLTGLDLERSGVIAGMSGSPVLVDGRVIGAVAYRLVNFGHEAIAGIIPIDQMLQIDGAARRAPTAVDGADVRTLLEAAAAAVTGDEAVEWAALRRGSGSGIEAVATPLALNGFRPDLARRLAPMFEGLGYAPVAGGVAGVSQEVEANFVPGGALAVQLMRGDVSVTASGTITYRDGDRLFAFGHPFLQGGRVDFPFVASEVITILSSANASSKLSVSGSAVRGSIREDRLAGIMGVLGAAPALIPVEVTLESEDAAPDTLSMEIVDDRMLTPLYLFLGIVNGVQSLREVYGEGSVELAVRFDLSGATPTLGFEDLFSSSNQAVVGLASTLAGVFGYLYDNPIGPVGVRAVQVTMRLRDDRRTAAIERVWYPSERVRPGEIFKLALALKPHQQPSLVHEIEIRIPDGTASGPLTVLIGAAEDAAREELTVGRGGAPTASTIEQLVADLNRRRRSDRLYVQLWRDRPGAVVSGRILPGLPGSVRSVLGSEQSRGDVTPVARAIIAETFEPMDYVISGSARITLTVVGR